MFSPPENASRCFFLFLFQFLFSSFLFLFFRFFFFTIWKLFSIHTKFCLPCQCSTNAYKVYCKDRIISWWEESNADKAEPTDTYPNTADIFTFLCTLCISCRYLQLCCVQELQETLQESSLWRCSLPWSRLIALVSAFIRWQPAEIYL